MGTVYVYFLEATLHPIFRVNLRLPPQWHYTSSGMANPEDSRNEQGYFLYEKLVVFAGPMATREAAEDAIEKAFLNCIGITRFTTSFKEDKGIAKQLAY